MQRSILFKNIYKKLTGQNTVNIYSRSDVFVKLYAVLHHYEGSGFNLAHSIACLYNLLDGLIGKLHIFCLSYCKQIAKDFFAADILKRMPKLRLKDYNNCKETDVKGVFCQPQYCIHLEKGRNQHKY